MAVRAGLTHQQAPSTPIVSAAIASRCAQAQRPLGARAPAGRTPRNGRSRAARRASGRRGDGGGAARSGPPLADGHVGHQGELVVGERGRRHVPAHRPAPAPDLRDPSPRVDGRPRDDNTGSSQPAPGWAGVSVSGRTRRRGPRMTVPPPFATTPPSGLPDLIEHDACALAAFATRDGRAEPDDGGARPDVAPDDGPPLRERRRRGRRERPAGRPAPAARGAGGWSARALDPAAADDPRFTVAHIFFDTPEDAAVQVPRIEEIVGEHGFEVLWSGEGTVDRAALGPRAAETPADLLADRLPGGRGAAPPRPPTATGRWCSRARARLPRRLVLGQRRGLQGAGPARGHPALLPGDGRGPRLRLVADHRPQPLLDEHVPHVQPGAAVLDPRAQRRDQHDRPAPRAERAARPADHARRLRQPGPEPPARGPDLREGPLAARGGRVRAAADPRRGPPPAREAAGPLRALPRGPRPLRAGPGRRWPAGRRTRWSSRSTRWACGRSGGSRPRTCTSVSSEPGIVPGGRAHPRPGAARAGREGRRSSPARTACRRCSTTGSVQREVYRARQEPRRPAARRDARPPGRRPRPGGRRGVPDATTSSTSPSSSSRPCSPRRAGSRATSSSSSSTPTAAPSRSARSAGTGRSGRSRPVPMPLSDYLQETVAVVTNPAIDREREVEHFSTRVVLGRRPPDRGRRAGAAAALRAAHADHPRRDAPRRVQPLSLPEHAPRRRGPGRGLHGGRAGRVGLARRAPAALTSTAT